MPIRSPKAGDPGGERDPHWIERAAGRLAEIPPVTLRLGGMNLPAAGGAYLRIFPYSISRAAIRHCERRGVPATIYVHPWELDPDQPRLRAGRKSRFRHYQNLRTTERKLGRLLSKVQFSSLSQSLDSELPISTTTVTHFKTAPSGTN